VHKTTKWKTTQNKNGEHTRTTTANLKKKIKTAATHTERKKVLGATHLKTNTAKTKRTNKETKREKEKESSRSEKHKTRERDCNYSCWKHTKKGEKKVETRGDTHERLKAMGGMIHDRIQSKVSAR
jgi:hypothetical protein